MAHHKNVIDQIRPESTFDSYIPVTDSQKRAKQAFQKVGAALAKTEANLEKGRHPFANAAFLSVSGNPGCGKTHLTEALLNYLKDEAPDVVDNTFLLRADFTLHMVGSVNIEHVFDNKPLIVIDDLFSKYQSVDDLHPRTDLKQLMQFIAAAYESKSMVITTSNFPFFKKILPRIEEVDTIGRITSRCREVFTRGGEIEIVGPDGRENITGGGILDGILNGEEKPVVPDIKTRIKRKPLFKFPFTAQPAF